MTQRLSSYYNEIDPYAAQWLRNLIAAGHIAPGDVDERSIEDVQPEDVRGYTQCHFFAGIGGWSYALRLAGWPDDRPVWTGSCPCQPFSSAGKGAGFSDSRHLWPTWFRLIRECAPTIVFGEQVASAAGLAWFDTVSTDLEAAAYAIGASDLCAAGVGGFHIRQRLWWLADADGSERRPFSQGRRDVIDGPDAGREGAPSGSELHSEVGIVDDTTQQGRQRLSAEGQISLGDVAGAGEAHKFGDTSGERLQGRDGADLRGAGRRDEGRSVTSAGAWDAVEWLPCRDGKARPVEPGTFPLAHGVSGRVGRLRAYGNAIVPACAAEFIQAYREAIGEDLHAL